jgi:hypothetical protein
MPASLPRHRLPADAHLTPRLAAGLIVLCPWQAVWQACATTALLEREVARADPDGGNCLATQVLRSKGSLN